MANKSTRLLSLLLAVLMIVSMATIVTSADYKYDETAATSTYYKAIPYDTLVGDANKDKNGNYQKGVYIVDADWAFEEGEAPKTVSFYFRGNIITEDYNPNRHLATVADMYTKAKANNVKMPYCILTAGNYSETIKLSDSVILLGANAGINPNVPHSDPTKPWELNPDRYLPDMISEDYGNETRIWAGIAETNGVKLCQTPREAGNTLKLFQISATNDAAKTYVVDGLLFQGYGASFYDANAGSGSRTYYLQNVIMNDNSAYDVSPIRLWGRGATTTVKKQMHFSNSYVYGNNSLYFYSGHAPKLYINGVSYQESSQDFVYNGMTMQWIGMDFAMTNCHLWNSEKMATTDLVDSHYLARFPYTSTSYAEDGSNTEPFHYNITNNTFCNMTAVDSTGALKSTTAPFLIYMASEDEMVKFEDNIFISTMSIAADQTRSPIQIRYNCLADGTISRASSEKVTYTSNTDAYALNEKNISIKNNIFSKEYCKPILIGTNTTPGTLIENKGNLYTEKYDGENVMTGMILANDSQTNYDKWVWLKYDPKGTNTDPKNRSDYIDEKKILINGKKEQENITVDLLSNEENYEVSVECNTTINSVKVYQADATFKKGAEIAADEGTGKYNLSAADRKNYYVLSVLSVDGRSSKDYKLTLNRAMKEASKLSGIVDEAIKTEAQDTSVDYFNYEVNYEQKTFNFTLNVPAGATTELFNEKGDPVQAAGTNTFAIPLDKVDTKYSFKVKVTSAEGVETYDLSLYRRKNERTELVVKPASGTASVSGNKWTVNLKPDDVNVNFSVEISEEAKVQITDQVYNAPLAVKNGEYTLSNLAVGETKYVATVTAQNGVDQQVWNLIFNRPTRTAAKLKGIRNASLAGGVYYAVTTGNRFMVSADYNYEDGATVGIYSDAACTRKYSSANLTLTALETKVWVKVTAEDGVTSVVAPLQITTSNLTAADDVYQGAMAGNGIIQVAGATQFNGDVVEVELPAGTKKYQFAASGLNGYRIRVYTDDKASLLTDSMQVLTLDSGLTKLYIDAIKGSEHKEFVVEIKAPQYYSFTDKATDWAKAYVEKLGTSGLAIMKGDEHMKFNGDNNLTRYEMAIMMVRVAGINKALYSKLSLTFTDAKDIPAWAADYLKAAYKYEMIGGYGVYEGETVVGYEFAGEKNATRSEFLKVFMNAVTGDATLFYEENKEAIDKKIEAKKFKDLDDMEDWAVPYVYSAIYKDVIKGDQNQKINPQDLITRNEVAVILGRYLCGMN